MTPTKPIRVLAVEDSPFFCKVLTDLLGQHAEIELVKCANDPYEARDLLLSTQIDVMTLDLELPRMSGLTFLKLIMERKPMPVIILSSLTPTGSQKAVEALITGAFAVIEKPTNLSDRRNFDEKLVREIKNAAGAPLRRSRPLLLNHCLEMQPASFPMYDSRQIIALGASTGGPKALEQILTALPANLPGIVVVQHIPAGFTASFAARLNEACAMEVREAKDGDIVSPGLVLIAPGGRHMEVQWIVGRYRVLITDGPEVEHQRPSVDVLFKSLARCAGLKTVGVLLTGMGKDGAAGMKRLHDLNALTIAQDEETSVVYGMAKQAVELGAVDAIAPLSAIPSEIIKALEKRHTPTPYTSYAQR